MADYVRCFSDPGTIAGSYADYRAAASTDLADDNESLTAGQKIRCRSWCCGTARIRLAEPYEQLSVWQEYAADVHGTALPAGHFLPEESTGLGPQGSRRLPRRELISC